MKTTATQSTFIASDMQINSTKSRQMLLKPCEIIMVGPAQPNTSQVYFNKQSDQPCGDSVMDTPKEVNHKFEVIADALTQYEGFVKFSVLGAKRENPEEKYEDTVFDIIVNLNNIFMISTHPKIKDRILLNSNTEELITIKTSAKEFKKLTGIDISLLG